jgi:regulator of protease activity HflC (stomatin/prohibitin superfamily)
MLLLKYLLIGLGSAGILGVMVAAFVSARRAWARGEAPLAGWPRKRLAQGLVLSFVALALGVGLVVVPAGYAAVRVSQVSGTRPGTLYPGVHLVKPFLEEAVLYDTRDQVWRAGQPVPGDKAAAPAASTPLMVQSREGLGIGLAVVVRYRLEPKRLDHIHATLPDVDREIVPSVVASAFRQLVPAYMVRDVFATRREEIRQQAGRIITETLARDGVVVKDVLLGDVVLPAEYAKGLEALLLKQQQSERMVYDVEIKRKEVETAGLEADADKARQVKAAEAQASVRVLQAKAEADAMQHTLPLKEKQIQQSRLEAEARKESTIKNAEAAGEAKVIDSKADVQRSRLMAEAEAHRSNLIAGADAHRVRTLAVADGERLKIESDILRENPLLIQKIVAERLSDKMQIMMVPMDGKNFFANEVFQSALLRGGEPEPREEAPRRTSNRR